MDGRYLIVGTAGHIDHGKTTLLRALTGVNLDVLPEERERGITIALGFTHLNLPSGRRLAFIDVPGHERFVRTMIAGAGGLNAALLCVSAIDGVMPQTREHLAILQLLGVSHGVVALTFVDAVDADLVELAQDDVHDLLQASGFSTWPVVPCSGVTGQGTDALCAALEALPDRDVSLGLTEADAPFRLPVDRVFTQRGHGTIATGTVRSGRVAVGEELELRPGGQRVRVRGAQVHGRAVDAAGPGFRTALNVVLPHDQIGRGFELSTPGQVPETTVVDVSYRHLRDAAELKDGSTVRILIGTSEVLGRVQCLSDPQDCVDAPGFLQLRLAEAIAALPGDRFVLRRESPMETLGGGRVVDPWAPTTRKKRRAHALKQLERLSAGALEVFLERAGIAGLTLSEAGRRTPGAGVQAGDRVLAPAIAARLEAALVSGVEAFHKEHPLRGGATNAELLARLRPRPSLRVVSALLDGVVAQGALRAAGGRFCSSSFERALNAEQQAACDRAVAYAIGSGVRAPTVAALTEAAAHPQAEALLRVLRDDGVLVRVDRFLYAREVLDAVVEQANTWLAQDGAFSPSDAKERLGVTRKHLIPLLEWLDTEGVTLRDGEVRRRGRRK